MIDQPPSAAESRASATPAPQEEILASAAEIAGWKRDSEILRRCNIVEIAVHNETGSVSEYMKHWESRALKAEAELAAPTTPAALPPVEAPPVMICGWCDRELHTDDDVVCDDCAEAKRGELPDPLTLTLSKSDAMTIFGIINSENCVDETLTPLRLRYFTELQLAERKVPETTPAALPDLEKLARRLKRVTNGFISEAINGVICTPPDAEETGPRWNDPPNRHWCARCKERWAELFAVADELEAALRTRGAAPARLWELARETNEEKQMTENPFINEWNDAVNCACDYGSEKHMMRWTGRVHAAGEALKRDYIKAIERANNEARLAVALRMKLEEVAGPDVASSIV